MNNAFIEVILKVVAIWVVALWVLFAIIVLIRYNKKEP